MNNVCRAAKGGYADKMKALSLLYTSIDNMSGNLGSVSRFTGLFYKIQPLYLSKILMEYCGVYKKILAEITILINTD